MDKVERDQRIRAVMDKMRATAPEGDFYRHAQVKREVGKLIDEAEEAKEKIKDWQTVAGACFKGDHDGQVALVKLEQERDALKAQLAEANAKVVAVLLEKRQLRALVAKHPPSCRRCGALDHVDDDCDKNIPAAARTLLDEHARYKKALEVERDSCDPRSEQSRLARLNEALSTPEPPKRRPRGDLEGMCPHENYDNEPCPTCDAEPPKEKP